MRSKEEKALNLLESMDKADDKLVQHAMYVDDPEKFQALSKPGFLSRWGAFAACLALLLIILSAPWALSKLPAAHPATQPPQTSTTTQPTASTSPELNALLARLTEAIDQANDTYTQALAYVTADFAAKPQGADDPAFTALAAQLEATRSTRVSALSALHTALQAADAADFAVRAAEAENLLCPCPHTYDEPIRHSSSAEGTDCVEQNYYQLCAQCNALLETKGQHDWHYVCTESSHQLSCRECGAAQDALPHAPNDWGACEDCGYVVNANILIIESIVGESQSLCAMIDSCHSFTVVNVTDPINMPDSLEKLQAYHEVILVNISHRDMPEGFDALLESYVRDFGGGLLTVGGEDAYHPEDVGGNCYGDMLPVDLTPPSMAVMILVDTSGSMWHQNSGQPYNESKLYAAVQGAEACLDVLTERDYVGVMSLEDYYTEVIELTPRTQRDKIVAAIKTLPEQGQGGTIFSAALERAGQILKAATNVDKKHIILITDGEPSAEDTERYIYMVQQNAAAGITMSIVGIQCTPTPVANMRNLLVNYAGMKEENFYDVQELPNVSNAMRDDLSNPALRAFQYQNYTPHITEAAIFPNITQEQLPSLGGAYRSKLKDGATQILSGPYGPVYAQWTYGNGAVGSFMCDLNGTWSAAFIDSPTGQQILNRIIDRLANPSQRLE